MIPFGEYLPDLPPFMNPGALEALNVIPGAGGYRPLAAFSSVTSALTARSQGAATFRNLAGTIFNFAGDATKLYKLDSTGLVWDDVSRAVGGVYATGSDGRWVFTQHGNSAFASNGVDALQEFTMGTDTLFALAVGSPPISTFLATIKDFLFLGRVASANNRVQWSGYNDPTTFTVSQTTQADQQDFADGGYVMGMIGGESGLVFRRNAIARAIYIGPPPIFQFDEISKTIGCMAEGSIASYEQDCFFLSDSGFQQILGQTQIVPIGSEKIDRYFLNDLDQSYLHRITSAISPQDKLYVVGYAGAGNSGGTPNRLLLYHWPTGRWSRAEIDHEIIYAAASQSGYTLDGLDAVNASIDALAYSLDSPIWSGTGRYLLSGFATTHKSGFFNGANMAATVDTAEAQLFTGQRAMVSGLRPLVDGSSATITVTPITRNRHHDVPVTGAAAAMQSDGFVPLRFNARYARARIAVAAGGTWITIQGVDDIEAEPAGFR